jgi:hypothetical protein
MPRAIDSLAVWPVMSGFLFMFRCLGLAYNEVVVALLEEPGARPALLRFARTLGGATSGILLLATVTPLGWLYFKGFSGLEEPLARLGVGALWIAIPLPAVRVFQSWYQGQLVHAHRTRGVSESVLIALGLNAAILATGVATQAAPGLYVMLVAAGVGEILGNIWLRRQVRQAGRALGTELPAGS